MQAISESITPRKSSNIEKLMLATQALIFDHDLRGYDAVHLASALVLKREAETEILYSCFARKLNRAAKAEGLHVHEELGSGQTG